MPRRIGLDFPWNGATGGDIRLVWTTLPRASHSAVWWAKYNFRAPGYRAVTWHSAKTGSFSGGPAEYGAHPYPCDGGIDGSGNATGPTGGTGTRFFMELAYGLDRLALPMAAAFEIACDGRWLLQGRTASNDGTTVTQRVYPDLLGDPTAYIEFQTALSSVAAASTFYIGCSDWAANSENPDAVLRGLKLFDAALTGTDLQTEGLLELDRAITTAGAASIYYSNINWTPTDTADKQTQRTTHDPTWDNSNRPFLEFVDDPVLSRGFVGSVPPPHRPIGTFSLLDVSTWGGASLNVGRWFADELGVTVTTDVTLAVSGVAASAAVGSVGDTISYTLSGNQASAAVGSVVGAITSATTGVVSTAAVGTVPAAITYAITSLQASGAAGTVTATGQTTAAITGVAATAAVGTPGAAVSVSITGTQASAAVGNVGANGAASAALTGTQATGATGTPVAVVAYAASGTAATAATGTLKAALSYAATGTLATGAPGTVSTSIVVALSGAQATAAVGTMGASSGADVSRSLTGVNAAAALGTLKSSLQRLVSGNSSTGQVGTVTNPAEVVFTAGSRVRLGAKLGNAGSRLGPSQGNAGGRIGGGSL